MFHSREAHRISSGFQFLEGPVWVDEDSPLLAAVDAPGAGLIFSDIPASRLYCLTAKDIHVLRADSGQANGSALDLDGSLLSCEHETRRVSRFDGDGAADCVTDRYDGKRLNSPNDIAVRSDGAIFFTDPPYGVESEHRELDFQGIYRLESCDTTPTLLEDNFEKPNGLAFSCDESTLYVADTERGCLRRFPVSRDGELQQSDLFCECERPDGICIDQADNVWVACMDAVEVFDRDGHRLSAIPLPERPANLAFGGADLKTVFICARTSLYTIDSDIAGALGQRVPKEASLQ